MIFHLFHTVTANGISLLVVNYSPVVGCVTCDGPWAGSSVNILKLHHRNSLYMCEGAQVGIDFNSPAVWKKQVNRLELK